MMLSELNDTALLAREYFLRSVNFELPTGVVYLGMGSSYIAPIAFKYMGFDIYPEIASEFYNYESKFRKLSNGVLISQSGKTAELLSCATLFDRYTAISNYENSPLCTKSSVDNIVPIFAGSEYTYFQTYTNTQLALFKGFGIDVSYSIDLLSEKLDDYHIQGKALAAAVDKHILQNNIKGMYITGSGPNISTALQGALILCENARLIFNGISLAQYEHGPINTAKDCIVIHILSKGKTFDRTKRLIELTRDAGAKVFVIEEPDVIESQSILHNIIPLNYMAYYLSNR